MPTGVPKKGYRVNPKRVVGVNVTCEICGKVRRYMPSELRVRGTIRFCSRACLSIGRDKKKTLTCVQCGVVFRRRRDLVKDNSCCSKKCAYKYRSLPNAKWRDRKQIRQYMVEYHRKNKERFSESKRISCANRRALKRRNGGVFTTAEWIGLCKKYEDRCLCCGRNDVLLTVDHVIPLSQGGKNDISNIQPLCGFCNKSKGPKHIDYRLGKIEEAYGIKILET